MEIQGRIQNGVIVLDDPVSLPEGVAVTVLIPALDTSGASQLLETEIVCESGKLPYVRGGNPGTWQLTNHMIAKIFDEEDVASMKGMLIDPS